MAYKDKERRKAYDRARYLANREARLAQMRTYSQTHPRERTQPIAYFVRKDKERRQKLREFLQAQKVGKSCSRCGMNDWRALDFHHVDQSSKEGTIGHAISLNWGKVRIIKEIEKCEILCANCHRILHWEMRRRVDPSE
jgi:hypothetical protein